MATCNFSTRTNSKNIFAFMLSSDYEKHCQDYANDPDGPLPFDAWQDWEKESIFEYLGESLKAAFTRDELYIENADPYDGDAFATLTNYIDFAGQSLPVEISLRLHAGYYEGFSIDWHIERLGENDRDCLPDLDDCRDILAWHYDGWQWQEKNKGLATMLAPKLQKRLQAKLDELTDRAEAVLAKVAQHRLAGAVFSNGEGIYWEAA